MIFAVKSRGNMVGKIWQFKSFFRQLRLSAERYYMWKRIEYLDREMKARDKYLYETHCKNGFHKWSPVNGEMNGKKYSYLECNYCNKLFFASMKEKQKYLRIKKQEKRDMEKWLNV